MKNGFLKSPFSVLWYFKSFAEVFIEFQRQPELTSTVFILCFRVGQINLGQKELPAFRVAHDSGVSQMYSFNGYLKAPLIKHEKRWHRFNVSAHCFNASVQWLLLKKWCRMECILSQAVFEIDCRFSMESPEVCMLLSPIRCMAPHVGFCGDKCRNVSDDQELRATNQWATAMQELPREITTATIDFWRL